MAKVLRCREIGVECDFEAKGRTVEEVLEKAKAHARTDHGVKRVTADYLKSWKKFIRNTP